MYGSYSYNYGYSNGAAGALAGMGAGATVISLALAVFGIVCMWKVFEKAGEPGWKCLIPIYNAYIFLKIAWEAKYFIYIILGIFAAILITALAVSNNSGTMAGIGTFLLVILYAAIFVMSIIAMVKLSKRFGKSGAFAIGLILLNVIFMAILAFGDCDYDRSRTDPGSSGGSYGGSQSSSQSGGSEKKDEWQ